MAENQGAHARANEEASFLIAIILVPLLLFVLWNFIGRYVYAWERVVLYGVFSLWGVIPTDWPVLGWFTRQFFFFRYTSPKNIEFAADAVHDSLVINGVISLVVLYLVAKRTLYISKFHPFNRFGRTMNLYDYIEQQKPMYPHLRVMWKLFLLGRPLREGLFRLGDSAKEYSIRNDLVRLA